MCICFLPDGARPVSYFLRQFDFHVKVSNAAGVKARNVTGSSHVQSVRKENRMPIESITLHCVRKDGRRETTELPGHTMSDARGLAKWVLNHWNGVYTEVDICAEDGTVETIQNPSEPSPVGTRDVQG
jgi:hypothetical protein